MIRDRIKAFARLPASQLRRHDYSPPGLSGMDLGRWRIELEDAREGLVSVAGSPWAASDPASRKAVSRAYERLAVAGLLILWGEGRTSYLSLTPEGEALARRLAGGHDG